MEMPHRVATIIDALEFWAEVQPEKVLYRFMPFGEGDTETVTYQQMLRRARSVASQLQSWKGERALLLFPSGLEFLEAFLGCLYAGVIAVPAYPPRRNHNFERLRAIMEDCTPQLVLASETVRQYSQSLFDDAFRDSRYANLQSLHWIVPQRGSDNDPNDVLPTLPVAQQIAFLQYTSGSTGNAKGVVISHDNLVHNEQIIHGAFDVGPDYHVVGWLPLFHDMGLIGLALYPLYVGIDALIMPPAAFLQKPFRWLKAISDMGREGPVGTVAPNFAWQLCVDQISDQQQQQLDLSALQFALTGAEPVRAETLDAFAERFVSNGFARTAFCPCYGLAEATLMVSCASRREPIKKVFDSKLLARNELVETRQRGTALISSGRLQPAQQIAIVDPESHKQLEPNRVGEIWVGGRSVSSGYWGNSAGSAATFQVFTSDNQGPWLRTGDLGVYIDGELYVAGRLKDMIIIRGRNIYPQDIEFAAANAHPALRKDSCAAFSVDIDNEERLVIAIEIERSQRWTLDPEIIFQEIRRAVTCECDVHLYTILLLRPGSILKTSSGKIQRGAIRKAFAEDNLSVVARWQETTTAAGIAPLEPMQPVGEFSEQSEASLQRWIAEWVAHCMHADVNTLDVHAPMTSLGIDSIDATRLMGTLESWAGYPIDPTTVWDHDSIERLAVYLVAMQSHAGVAKAPDASVFEGTI